MDKDLKTIIYDLEISLLKSEIRSSTNDLDLLLADDFREFGSSGKIYDKKLILERLPRDTQISPVEFLVSDFKIQELAENIILATFKTGETLHDKSHVVAVRTSIWRRNNNNWQMVFHQGTPVK
jgi:hypothetical protein